jgi:dihydropteroate synthase
MGIVNLTDDSYYAPSRLLGAGRERLVGHVGAMVAEGMDILDIGACSTRPGSRPVGAEVEWTRLQPALEAIREAFPDLEISIDTYWASVVRKAFEAIGPFLVNDISAGEDDPDMLPAVGALGLPYVAMHKKGTPATMQALTDYDDVVEDVFRYFEMFAERAAAHGISDWILDPGFGFAKTVEQNYRLLADLGRFRAFGRPILVGLSRKSMIYKPLGITPEEALPATQALHMAALERGASILRVHDVRPARETAALYATLSGSSSITSSQLP